MPTEQTMSSAARLFFTSPHIAVAGASSSPHKFGYKIFAWYLQHSLTPTPINPSCSSVTIQNTPYTTLSSPKDLLNPTQTSLSVITPPQVTEKLLKEAKEAGVRSVWLQPGSFTEEILEWAEREWPGAAVGGYEEGTRGGEGWCVLVDGERAMKEAAKEQKL